MDSPHIPILSFTHLQYLLKKEEIMWKCSVCGYEYEEAKEGTPFEKLPDDWTCPVCGAPKDAFEKVK